MKNNKKNKKNFLTSKQILDSVRNKFKTYNVQKMWIENEENAKVVFGSDKKIDEKIEKYKKSVNFIDAILLSMDPDEAILLKDIYIHKKPKESLYLSETTFYLKHKKAVISFLEYLD